MSAGRSDERRTRSKRHPRLALAVLCGAALLLAGCAAKPASTRSTKPPATYPSTTTGTMPPPSSTTTTTTPPARRVDDGSLGNWATRAACKLLDRGEIQREFGGPVTPATAVFPYCQWLVGKDGFLALDVEPNTPFKTATRWVVPLAKVTGVGTHAIIGDNRYMYFSDGPSSFWLLWQQVGDFTSLHETQLTALARDVLAHAMPSHEIASPPPPAPGPPVYFAGDSTAAGPEWAWVTYHTGIAPLRTLAEYQVGSGLVVPQYFAWPRHLLAEAAERRPKLVIYMGSANDDQDLPYKGGFAAVGTAAWRAAYARRVGSAMSWLTREGAKVLWIGEPAMQSPALSQAMLDMDEVCQAEAAAHRGVTFFNPGTVFNLPGWRYTPTAVVGGHRVDVRLDGVHLNTAGSILLADKLAPVIRRLLGVK
jgi:lysophospholipase L1-like esterase